MITSRSHRLLVALAFVLAVLVICGPPEADTRQVIFNAPRRELVLTGQILSSRAKQKPCEKCYMRDHRGHCRRVISFNADGVKC